MEEPTREKFYEKYAWVILFVIGILIFFGGIPHMFGNNSDPELVEIISGKTIQELKSSTPLFFDLYNFYFSGGGLSDVGVGFFLIVVSMFAYRTGQKWAWYSYWFVPLFFIGWLFLISPLPDLAQSMMFVPLILFVVSSLLGLLLPIRKFFPKKWHRIGFSQ